MNEETQSKLEQATDTAWHTLFSYSLAMTFYWTAYVEIAFCFGAAGVYYMLLNAIRKAQYNNMAGPATVSTCALYWWVGAEMAQVYITAIYVIIALEFIASYVVSQMIKKKS